MIIRRACINDLGNYIAIHNSYFVLKYNCMSKLNSSEAIVQLKRDNLNML